MKTLNDITSDLLKINQLIEDSVDEHGEIKPEVADELAAWFAQTISDRSNKLDAYLGLIREKEMRAVAAKAQKEQWDKKAKSETRGVEWLKEKLFHNLQLLGETKVVTASGRVISIQKNGGSIPVVIDEEKFNSLPEESLALLERMGVIVFQPMIEKSNLRDLLATDPVLFSFAKLGERGESLRIR